jgi:hypothetical protein
VAGCPGLTTLNVCRAPLVPITGANTEVGDMAGRGIEPALRSTVEHGKYEVDSRAVAEAIMRSWVLIAAEARDRAVRAHEEKPAPR